MPICGRIERVPADKDGARLFLAIEPQQDVGEPEDCTGRLVAAPQNVFRQSVIHAVRERIPVDYQKRPRPRFCRLRFRAGPCTAYV